MSASESIVCQVCKKPVRVIARPPQKHRRLADHGPHIGVLCNGSGVPAPVEMESDTAHAILRAQGGMK